MAKKKIKDFKTMKLDALKTELIANRKVLFENNFKHKMGQLKAVSYTHLTLPTSG